MNQIKIKDNTKVDKNSLTKISNLCGRIANKTLKQLENEGVFVFPEFILETDDLTKDQTILKSNGDTLYFGNVMGFIGYGKEERLIINPSSRKFLCLHIFCRHISLYKSL